MFNKVLSVLVSMLVGGVAAFMWLHHHNYYNSLQIIEEEIRILKEYSVLQQQNQHVMMDNVYHLFNSFKEQSQVDIDQALCFYSTEYEKNIQTLLKFQFPKVYDIEDVIMCSVSAYTNTKNECDDTPNITADGSRVKRGYIALSRDLIDKWGGSKVYGREVVVLGHGVFEVRDTMNERYEKSADIFFFDKKYAEKFGRKHGVAVILLKG